MEYLVKPTVGFAFFLMAIISMMILPIPSWLLDIGLAVSFGIAILIFTVTLFIERPLEFSSFPTILIVSLMLRLALNVSSTKLIIGEGHTGTHAAGHVIEGFAEFVMGGSVFLGLVVFGVLMIVNFTVITKGATRMAEVGARFALDGMPGKQLAIDADMAAGAITHAEAKERRDREQQETTFFGSLDGASKFVKGDAVAGLLITLLNLIMGILMGVIVHDLSFMNALETYSILTVGDGLVSQFPAVIISISAGLLLARGGALGSTDLTVIDQLSRYPSAIATVAVLMALFAIVPGFPFLPFFVGAIILGSIVVFLKKRALKSSLTSNITQQIPETVKRSMGDLLAVDDIHVQFSSDLVDMILDPGNGMEKRVENMRNHIASYYGVILSEIRLTDSQELPSGTYVINIHGAEFARGTVQPNFVLAIAPDNRGNLPAGHDVVEPVFGAPARWIRHADQETAAIAGITLVEPTEVLATHLLEVLKRNFSRLLTLKALNRLLDELTNLSNPVKSESNQKLINDLIPERVTLDILHSVLRLLLEEQVSIRNLPLILEAISEVRSQSLTPESICEHVRQRLSFQLISNLKRKDGTIPLIQLEPDWETIFSNFQIDGVRGGFDIALPPDKFELLSKGLANEIKKAEYRDLSPAIVTSARRRRFLKTIMAAKGLNNPVLSFEEIGFDARPSLVGTVAA